MPEDNETVGTDATETMSVTAPPEFVLVHSMVRARTTRLQRYRAAEHHSFKQYVMGGKRLIRRRPLKVTWAKLLEHLGELRSKCQAGMVEVRLMGGQRVDLDALSEQYSLVGTSIVGGVNLAEVVEPAPATPPKPEFRLDSAAFDKPSGIPIPHFMGGVPPNDAAANEAAERLAAEKAEEVARKVGEPEGQGEPAPEAMPEEPVATEQELESLLEEASEPAPEGPIQPAPEPPAPEGQPAPKKPKRGHR